MSFDEALALRGRGTQDPASFVLTQFTSGSTSEPRGVVLDGKRIVANIRAQLEWLQPAPGDGACTWLPLSHDMGLIGMFLGSIAGATDDWARGGDLVVMTPQGFMRNPASWLVTCEAFGSTITAAPNFGYEMAARRRTPLGDLSKLRVCIAGAEPVRTKTLRRFADQFRAVGFDSTAFCPAYGMAEACLAVTGTAPEAHWQSSELAIPADDETAPSDHTEVVSSGPPLGGFEVRTTNGSVGEVLIKGPSIADSYVDGTKLADQDGWMRTGDLGALEGGELYVLGRTHDVLYVGGRNVYAVDVETYAGEVTGVRFGRVAAVQEDSALTLVAECDTTIRNPVAAERLARDMRQRVLSRVGLSPRRVLLTPRGKLPLTASGKIRRTGLLSMLRSGSLEALPGSIE
jgi:acyl-CoA synthetase (AMP-forming)/AMP-acid ligase II